VTLEQDLEQAATAATAWAKPGEAVLAVIAAEPDPGLVVYLVALAAPAAGSGAEEPPRGWVALDRACTPIDSWPTIRDAISIAAMCEVAEEMAGGGDLDDLRSQLVGLRLVENPPGIDEAIAAVDALERALGRPPRIATPRYLDSVGGAVRQLELALGTSGASPFAEAMKTAPGAIEALTREVEAGLRTRQP
jgi:hypothetical protein